MQSCTQRHLTEFFQGDCAELLCLLAIFLPHTCSPQIFPIWESSIQRLRVKLVGLKQANRQADYQKDVRDLGVAMCWIATNRGSPCPDFATQLQSLKSYDPSLYFLISWMTNSPPKPVPSMEEVLRHPYFMSPAQRQTFGIAIGGGMIGAYLCENLHENSVWQRNDALCRAVWPELKTYFNHHLGLMFDETTAAVVSSGSGGVDAIAAGKGLVAGSAAADAALSSALVLSTLPVDEGKYCDQVAKLLSIQPHNTMAMASLGDRLPNPYGGRRARAEAKREKITFKTTADVLAEDRDERFCLFKIGSVNFVRLAADSLDDEDDGEFYEWFEDLSDHEDRNHDHDRHHSDNSYRREERQKERNRSFDRRGS
jgi:hypothetical protein